MKLIASHSKAIHFKRRDRHREHKVRSYNMKRIRFCAPWLCKAQNVRVAPISVCLWRDAGRSFFSSSSTHFVVATFCQNVCSPFCCRSQFISKLTLRFRHFCVRRSLMRIFLLLYCISFVQFSCRKNELLIIQNGCSYRLVDTRHGMLWFCCFIASFSFS